MHPALTRPTHTELLTFKDLGSHEDLKDFRLGYDGQGGRAGWPFLTVFKRSAPLFIVALLEVAVTGARLDGRRSLARVVAELWGDRPRTPQDARRALSRLLAVDWHGGTVADHAAQSRQLTELKIQELVKRALTEKGRHDT